MVFRSGDLESSSALLDGNKLPGEETVYNSPAAAIQELWCTGSNRLPPTSSGDGVEEPAKRTVLIKTSLLLPRIRTV